MKNKKSAMISCNDGFRPVSFLLEVMESEAEYVRQIVLTAAKSMPCKIKPDGHPSGFILPRVKQNAIELMLLIFFYCYAVRNFAVVKFRFISCYF